MKKRQILGPTFNKDQKLNGFVVLGEMSDEFYDKTKEHLAPILQNNQVLGYLSILNHQETLNEYFEQVMVGKKIMGYTLKIKPNIVIAK